MGLFDMFLSDEKRIARAVRKLTNRDSQPEDREQSARWLAEKGTPEAIAGLCARFDLALEHQLKDAGEKEFVYSLLLELGDAAVPSIRSWLRQCKTVALPMRLLGDLAGGDAALDMASELLARELEKDDFKPDKKKALLIWMAEQRDDRCVAAAIPFLADFDEGVRYAAAEVLLAQQGEGGREPLWAALVNPKEESNRLRVRIAEGFIARRFKAGELPEGVSLPDGFDLRGDFVVKT